MKKLLMTVFVVNWANGVTYQRVECKTPEPEGVVCALMQDKKESKEFKRKDAAEAFKEALEWLGAQKVKLEKK